MSCIHQQMHEQLIGELNRNSDGVIGLKQNPSEIRHHLVVGPDLPRLTQELDQPTRSTDECDHEQYAKFHSTSKADVQVKAPVEAFLDLGNPFLEDSDTYSFIKFDPNDTDCYSNPIIMKIAVKIKCIMHTNIAKILPEIDQKFSLPLL